MDAETIKKAFIDATIKIGSSEGLFAITTRNLVKTSKINQYYLYSTFDDVYDVQLQAYLYVCKQGFCNYVA